MSCRNPKKKMWLGRGGGGGGGGGVVVMLWSYYLIHPSLGGIGWFCQVRILLVRWLLWDEIWKGKGGGREEEGGLIFETMWFSLFFSLKLI